MRGGGCVAGVPSPRIDYPRNPAHTPAEPNHVKVQLPGGCRVPLEQVSGLRFDAPVHHGDGSRGRSWVRGPLLNHGSRSELLLCALDDSGRRSHPSCGGGYTMNRRIWSLIVSGVVSGLLLPADRKSVV